MQNNLLISGYAAVFGVIDAHNDILLPRFLETWSLSSSNYSEIPVLWNHKGYSVGKSIEISADTQGIKIKALLTPAPWQIDLISLGVVNGLSIGYKPIDYVHDQVNNIRYLKKIDVREKSLVHDPANRFARITAIQYF